MTQIVRLYAALALSVFTPASMRAQAPSISIVSAASYQPALAPGSLASIFGSNLARQPASATLDENGQLPTELDGTSVQVAGVAAPLIYVSPRQINFVIPNSTPAGSVDVTVQSTLGQVMTSVVQVNTTAPALFALDASGSGAGAILNAVTYAPAPFLVLTDAIAGADQRTRLAIYATGVRYAGNLDRDPATANVAGSITVQARDATGTTYDLPVEYAGPAPGYFGLDQVNVVLPAELDLAGTVALNLNTPDASSNTVTVKMNTLPASAVRLAGISIAPQYVSAGDTATGTVFLNGRAPAAGVTVSLRSSGLAAQTPPTVLVPAGKVSAQFNVTTTFVATTQTVTVTAQANGASQAAMLEVDPATAVTLQNLTVDPSAVQGGRSVTATVTLSGTAAGSGATIPITSDSSAIIAPSVITVPFGRQIASATISTSTVTMPQIVTLSAVYGRSSKQATVTVSPAFTLALSSSSVTGGNSVQGSITLGGPQTGIVLFAIASSDPSVIASPATVSITPGQTSASFSLNTMRVNATRTVTVTASSSSFTAIKQSASLAVLAPASAALQSISITPNRVTGGQAATGTLTLTAPAPAGGVTVVLRSSSAAAQLTTSVVLIPQGQAGSNFQITTTPVITTQTSTITATASGVSKTATLTVQ